MTTYAEKILRTKAGHLLSENYFSMHHTGGGCMAWKRISESEKHYVMITDEHGTGLGEDAEDLATSKWAVGVYDENEDFRCGYFTNLNVAIAWCLRALELDNPLTANPEVAPTGINLVKDSDIEEAAQVKDLDEALLPIMNLAGITDGGIAGVCFSDVNFDWETADMKEREDKVRQWISVERSYQHTEETEASRVATDAECDPRT